MMEKTKSELFEDLKTFWQNFKLEGGSFIRTNYPHLIFGAVLCFLVILYGGFFQVNPERIAGSKKLLNGFFMTNVTLLFMYLIIAIRGLQVLVNAIHIKINSRYHLTNKMFTFIDYMLRSSCKYLNSIISTAYSITAGASFIIAIAMIHDVYPLLTILSHIGWTLVAGAMIVVVFSLIFRQADYTDNAQMPIFWGALTALIFILAFVANLDILTQIC